MTLAEFLREGAAKPFVWGRCDCSLWPADWVASQVGFDPATGNVVEGGVEAQTERAVANVDALLSAAGLRFGDVVKVTVFLKNMSDFAAMNAIYARSFAPEGVVPPARSTVEVARLPKDALVEIEVIARFSRTA